jgi:short-subunit dehydrogenase
LELSERSVLVTGASRGIGAAITAGLLAEGCRVIGVARNFKGAFSSADRFEAIELDLSELDNISAQFRSIRRKFGNLNALVCNAGYGRFGSLEEFSSTQIRDLIDLNLTSQILLTREFLPAMKKQGFGDIVFMGSEAALRGGKRGAVYSATKFALRGFAESLREECSGTGVRVSIINPGMVATDFFEELSFQPGKEADCHLLPDDIYRALKLILTARPGININDIELSPHRKLIEFK